MTKEYSFTSIDLINDVYYGITIDTENYGKVFEAYNYGL